MLNAGLVYYTCVGNTLGALTFMSSEFYLLHCLICLSDKMAALWLSDRLSIYLFTKGYLLSCTLHHSQMSIVGSTSPPLTCCKPPDLHFTHERRTEHISVQKWEGWCLRCVTNYNFGSLWFTAACLLLSFMLSFFGNCINSTKHPLRTTIQRPRSSSEHREERADAHRRQPGVTAAHVHYNRLEFFTDKALLPPWRHSRNMHHVHLEENLWETAWQGDLELLQINPRVFV